ncbi:hypothetical protein LGN04_14035 [Burkholderia multivorans]|uniref:Uncharacterized protein n=2 Tax=Burkholderia multivorans TaxID=87883 RepID=A0AAP2HKW9_9BURK|nr:DUF6708 domain-containing protein [Burkholderia multivorans]AOJ95097.1 hypothetical protein WK22_19235 [Burkholderia multivorans]MBU9238173.1 hypothetical protein [Burkholderia multivorans]MBU9333206.1 hypothetical protein [Burkholderia multivorans]MBU9358070.1 hypothetical protein [Burkholderia multivorans]MBU9362627.1 hypothetical protein [Burkholderia multivorans]
MAFDGLSWYRLNRPVSEDEHASRLAIGERASDTPKDDRSVFSMTENCLEVRNGTYSEKGWGLLAFMLPGIGSLAAVAFVLWLMTHLPPIYEQRGQQGLMYGALSFFLFIGLCFSGLGIWALTRDCFNYISKPVRFDRRNRMIHAFKHNGPGGVISVPWDSAFLYIERKPRQGLARTAPRMVRCLVLDDKGLVKDTFSVGTRVVLAFEESSVGGREVMKILYQDFEFYRRFMEEGPASLPPVTEYLPRGASLRNALKVNFAGWSDMVNSRNPMVWLVIAIGVLPSFIFSLMQWFAQLTCRQPVWPDDIEQACSAAAPSNGLTA